MAHQFIAQLDPVIKDAVFGNVGSMAVFRVGNEDAQALQNQFSPTFSVHDIMNIPNYKAYVRMLANGVPTIPFSIDTLPPIVSNPALAQHLMAQSLMQYGRPRAEVESEIQARYQKPVLPTMPPAL